MLDGPLQALDSAVRRAARGAQTPLLYEAARAFTTALQPAVAMALLLVIAVATGRVRRHPIRSAAVTGTVVAGLALLVLAVKGAVTRQAPNAVGVTETGWYPSGHTSSLLVCAGAAAMLLWAPGSRARRRGLLAVGAAGGVMAAALVYCSFHWLTDVLAAAAASWLVLAAVARVDKAGRDAERSSASSSTTSAPAGDSG